MSKFLHLFPLSVYRDRIMLDPQYKQQLIDHVLALAQNPSEKPDDSAWLGDTAGSEFLFQRPEFRELYRQISAKVRAYVEALGIDTRLIDFYYQRSWATVTRRGERIHEHSHEQSNISFAYYLKKPPGSGGIEFITYDHPNEISKGVFTPDKQDLGFIARPSMLTWNRVHIEASEDEIFIFPSKTLHATSQSETDEPRISISADVTTLLKKSRGHETMMPHFTQWQRFED